jgi:hypothetical protein
MTVVGLIREQIPKIKPAAMIDICFEYVIPRKNREKPEIKATANSRSTIISPDRNIPEDDMEHSNPAMMLASIFLVIIKANKAANTDRQLPKKTCDQRMEAGAVPIYSIRA